jgi:hypothetical protein
MGTTDTYVQVSSACNYTTVILVPLIYSLTFSYNNHLASLGESALFAMGAEKAACCLAAASFKNTRTG